MEEDRGPGPRPPLWDSRRGTDGCPVKQAHLHSPLQSQHHTPHQQTRTLDPSTRHPSLAAPDTGTHTGAHADPRTPHQHTRARRVYTNRSLQVVREADQVGAPLASVFALEPQGRRQPRQMGARTGQEERLFPDSPYPLPAGRERGVCL